MAAPGLKDELLGLEREYWEAMRKKDGGAAERLTDDECVLVGSQGASMFKPSDLAAMLQGGSWEIKGYDLDEKTLQVRAIGDAAIVAYKITEQLIVDGETVELEAFDSSVWVRHDGGWVCALHTESIAGDPFGRDRRK